MNTKTAPCGLCAGTGLFVFNDGSMTHQSRCMVCAGAGHVADVRGEQFGLTLSKASSFREISRSAAQRIAEETDVGNCWTPTVEIIIRDAMLAFMRLDRSLGT